ncbi:type II toxin-antitoxin system HicA family toxin [Granulicella pectinivorans]|uniref:type II toxin-antitoxin system HicA family toxin n=1 Tax=Granulicella pectinivorans TaxID=474950 RepID=UPI001C3123F3
MGTLTNISGEEAAKAFMRAGWERQGQRGSHLVLSKPGMRCHLTIPQHKELARGRFVPSFECETDRG